MKNPNLLFTSDNLPLATGCLRSPLVPKPPRRTALAPNAQACFLFLLLVIQPFSKAGSFPALKVPDGIGVSLHFTNPKTSEMQAMSAAGIRWLRTDLYWQNTETSKGVYNFGAYDALANAANTYGMKIMFILCYNHTLYDGGYSPYTPEGRTAFANWARAAVAHFQGRGYIWELYNEPNLSFWSANWTMSVHDKALAYSQLAQVVGPAIKSSFPNELLVGPSVGYFDGYNANFSSTMDFLQTSIQQGACAYFDGMTVHPYRTIEPEYAWPDYYALNGLINDLTYNTTGKYPRILSGEWGYTATWFGGDEVQKAIYVSRSILHNYLCNVPISIIYDWESGSNPSDPELNFGMVADYNRNVANPVVSQLPTYRAVKTIYAQLNGYTFDGRIDTGNYSDFVFKFTKDGKSRYVAWNAFGQPNGITIPAAGGVSVTVTSYDGGWVGHFTSGSTGGFYCGLTSAPQFVVAAGQ